MALFTSKFWFFVHAFGIVLFLNTPLLLVMESISIKYLIFVLAEALAIGVVSTLLVYHTPKIFEKNSPVANNTPCETAPTEKPKPEQTEYEILKDKELVVHESNNKN